MRIGVQAKSQIVLALICMPHLGPTKEKALFGRKPINFLLSCLLVLIERFLQSSISELDAANVRDVFTLS